MDALFLLVETTRIASIILVAIADINVGHALRMPEFEYPPLYLPAESLSGHGEHGMHE